MSDTLLLTGGPAEITVKVAEDGQSATIMAGGDRLLTLSNAGGHIEFRAHMAPGGGIYETTESGHLSVPPG